MTRIALIGGGRIGEALIAGLLESGRAVKDLVVAETVPQRAAELAERCALNALAAVKSQIGELERIRRIARGS